MRTLQTFQKRVWTSGPALLIYVLCAAGVAFGIWATQSTIDELARARGQIVTVDRTQVVQAAQDGVLAALLVQEGQTVEQGDLLARLDDTRTRAAHEDSLNKVAALQATLARLRAEVYGEPLRFPPSLDAFPAFRENQRRLYLARRQSLEQAIEAMRENQRLIHEELSITEPLLITGDIGQAEVLRLRRQDAEVHGQIINLRNRFFQEAQTDMTRAEEELVTQTQLLEERAFALRQTELRAPLSGTVRRIVFSTIGASLRNGDVLLEMLPLNSELIVEAQYAPADVASLRLGLPARIKLDAFDDSIYGAVDATVSFIGPDALSEPDGRGGERIFYLVRLQLGDLPPAPRARPHDPIVIKPGMTVTVEVRTRERTVWSYLTKPITKTLGQSLTER